jgi:hypothetical protein
VTYSQSRQSARAGFTQPSAPELTLGEGMSTIVREDVQVLEGPSNDSAEGRRSVGLTTLSKANEFATEVAGEGLRSGMPPLKSIVFGLSPSR